MKTAEEIIEALQKTGVDIFFYERALEAMELYASQFRQEWIPVEILLPEDSEYYWVWSDGYSTEAIVTGMTSKMTGNRIWQSRTGRFLHYITHWQPLPPKPKTV